MRIGETGAADRTRWDSGENPRTAVQPAHLCSFASIYSVDEGDLKVFLGHFLAQIMGIIYMSPVPHD